MYDFIELKNGIRITDNLKEVLSQLKEKGVHYKKTLYKSYEFSAELTDGLGEFDVCLIYKRKKITTVFIRREIGGDSLEEIYASAAEWLTSVYGEPQKKERKKEDVHAEKEVEQPFSDEKVVVGGFYDNFYPEYPAEFKGCAKWIDETEKITLSVYAPPIDKEPNEYEGGVNITLRFGDEDNERGEDEGFLAGVCAVGGLAFGLVMFGCMFNDFKESWGALLSVCLVGGLFFGFAFYLLWRLFSRWDKPVIYYGDKNKEKLDAYEKENNIEYIHKYSGLMYIGKGIKSSLSQINVYFCKEGLKITALYFRKIKEFNIGFSVQGENCAEGREYITQAHIGGRYVSLMFNGKCIYSFRLRNELMADGLAEDLKGVL